MSDQEDIPMLDDLIEKGIEITLSDLGLDDDPPLRVDDVMAAEARFASDDSMPVDSAPFAASSRAPRRFAAPPASTGLLADNPALEQAVRRILDEHMELAWQEIRFAIQQHLDRS